MLEHQLRSHLKDVISPAYFSGEAAIIYSLFKQLEQSQWWAGEKLRQQQFKQAEALLKFAFESVPFYRARLEHAGWSPGIPLTEEMWLRIPVLSRAELNAHWMDVRSAQPPTTHGSVAESQTSGSTGQPVRFQSTAITRLMWNALTLRHYSWHIDTFTERLCAIRPQKGVIEPEGRQVADWGNPFRLLFKTGPSSVTDCRQDSHALLDWMGRQNADYLLTLPSTLEAMGRASPHGLPAGVHLKKIFSYAETLRPEIRTLIQNAWNVPIVDMYSSQEVGYVALQCPQCEQYHIQSESLLVEVLDAQGRPCQPGEIGKVVLTSLLNFASPLIRYEIQDYAEMGSACGCGRGLPTINRVMGRVRNLIALPDGGRAWPVLYASSWSHIAPIRQLQLIQKTPRLFHARALIDRELTGQEKADLTEAFRTSLGFPFDFEFHYLEAAIINPNGKFEAIISEVPPD